MAGQQLRERIAVQTQRATRSQTLDPNSSNAVPNSQPPEGDDDELLQREERAHRRRMMQLEAAEAEARIENLRQASSATSGRSQGLDDICAGENYTPAITNIINEMPGIAPRDIYLISEQKFDPVNLSRLHVPSAAAPSSPRPCSSTNPSPTSRSTQHPAKSE
ncbi:uncharacterized protein BDR25DRAFT_303470 [Lindgomyces ingoldianus]|uniref:Uncharacterized protein n=1 Tax=Lindgomyces ingoldianus TaxID=673940 RepID=A0ACB6QW93_9PLEO|nr:uncharacterized protein BDR25DRAFT_303470 [Lindgomyces ingoldianus]KAF2470843.1 hypothetical protein BDR25DRAFT_303470 [Lindgomyces ingoldianus]